MSRRFKRYIGLAVGTIIVVALGGLSTLMVHPLVERQIRDELTSTVGTAAAAVDVGRLRDLSYSEADATDPNYISLREQMIRMGDVFRSRGVRWIYLVKVFGKEARFAMDSSSDYTPPGEVYQRPPPAVFDVARDGQTRFVGPYTDEFGSYYSVFSPIPDPADKSTVALMGADIETAYYDEAVSQRQWLPWLITVLSAFLFTIIYLYLTERVEERRLRREAEAERQRHAKEREALLLNIREGVVAVGLDGKVIFVNPFAAEMLGLPVPDCLGRPYREHWLFCDASGRALADDRQPIPVAFTEKTERTYPLTARLHLARRDGEKMAVIVSVAPVDINDKIVAVVLAIRDVRQEAEIDRMKTEFISIASHQLRSPIGGLKNATSMLMDGSFGEIAPKAKDTLGAMSGIIERMAETVNVLLDVSRIESGKLVVVPEPTDIGKLAEDTVKENDYAAKAKKQDVSLRVQPDLPKISVDPKLVREIYKNLLTNAIKYTPEAGQIEICIRSDGPEALSLVKDNGYGIPEKDRARVFQKFYRGDNIVGLKETGTGLGLYCVKMLVEASGGRMWFESAEKKGTTFYFTLPLAGSKPKEADKAS